ncbi:MAG: tRNA guanosine(34) transglycosylase Tgt [Phycisphaerae bacterium]|nr:tRNA guanosine(34) transglycosylase Tgt [Phycisphaerae bacterium]
MFNFELKHKCPDTEARLGKITTPHGEIDTPVFMPVGTRGSVKGIMPKDLRETGAQIILGNTYHLLLKPGADVVEKLGGLQEFTSWKGPMLTDSGGFQVFSLGGLNRIGEDSVQFKSHIDGQLITLCPKSATKIQNQLGADIIMAFDECVKLPCPRERMKEAVERTIRWAGQSLDAHARKKEQWMFGIVQGGTDRELRHYCAEKLIEFDFPGYAIGGLSVGESHTEMIDTTRFTAKVLPENKPRYLMGVGTPKDMIAAISCGVDMFDCVIPTRNGRHGFAFTAKGPVRFRNEKHKLDSRPLDEDCDCYTCRNFSRGYLRHLFMVDKKSPEMLGPILVTLHNLAFYQWLMKQTRQAIKDDCFESWARQWTDDNEIVC